MFSSKKIINNESFLQKKSEILAVFTTAEKELNTLRQEQSDYTASIIEKIDAYKKELEDVNKTSQDTEKVLAKIQNILK